MFNEYINGTDAMRHLKLKDIHAIVADTTYIVSALHHALPKRTTSSSSAASPRQPSPSSGKQGDGKRSPAAAAAGGSGSGSTGQVRYTWRSIFQIKQIRQP